MCSMAATTHWGGEPGYRIRQGCRSIRGMDYSGGGEGVLSGVPDRLLP